MKLSKLNITVTVGIIVLIGCGIYFLVSSRTKTDNIQPSTTSNVASSTTVVAKTTDVQDKEVKAPPINNQEIAKGRKVSLTILFSRHIRSGDIPISLLKNEVAKSDVVILEEPFWTSVWEDGFNAISRSEMTVPQLLNEWQISSNQQKGDDWQFLVYLMNNLYGSNTYITSVDLTEDELLSQNIRNAVINLPQIEGNNFRDILQTHKQKFIDFANLTIQREDVMVDRYSKLVKNIQNSSIPQLKEKNNINILYILGVNHTRVFDLLKKRGFNINKIFSYDPYAYNYSGEVTVDLLSKKSVSDDLFARELFESAFEKFIAQSWLEDDQKSSRLERKIISQFSFEELESIFNTMLNSQDQYRAFTQSLISIAKQKNIVIPLSKAEFNAYAI